MSRTFLVTGASGFVGGNLAKTLVERGDRVHAHYRPGDNTVLLEGLPVEHLPGDLCDVDLLHRAATGCDGVFHTAGNMSFLSWERPLQHRVNVDGTRAVVEACRKAGVRRLVHTATINTMGIPHPEGAEGDENTLFNWEPLDFHYAITKRRGEELALAANGPSLEVVVVNPGTIFGPGDVNFNAGSYIRVIAKSPLPFYPEGGTNCVHVDAVVAGHLAAFERGRPGERYVLGGENVTYREMFMIIAEVLGRPRPRFEIPYSAALAAATLLDLVARPLRLRLRVSAEAVRAGRHLLFYSSAKARRELDLPFIPFRRAVEDAVRWYRAHGML
jgi:dihydroflavonol-4-reductase